MMVQPANVLRKPPTDQRVDEGGEILIPAAAVCRRHGVVQMTLWRRMRDDRLGFPQPVMIGRRRFFRLAEIEAWERGLPKQAVS